MDLGSIKETKLTIDEEREAIAHARAGSREAFDALIAAYVRNLRGAAWALVRAGSGGGRARVTREEAERAALIAPWDTPCWRSTWALRAGAWRGSCSSTSRTRWSHPWPRAWASR